MDARSHAGLSLRQFCFLPTIGICLSIQFSSFGFSENSRFYYHWLSSDARPEQCQHYNISMYFISIHTIEYVRSKIKTVLPTLLRFDVWLYVCVFARARSIEFCIHSRIASFIEDVRNSFDGTCVCRINKITQQYYECLLLFIMPFVLVFICFAVEVLCALSHSLTPVLLRSLSIDFLLNGSMLRA